jgi:peroxisomal coenzyme A diphosphatase NUDT7
MDTEKKMAKLEKRIPNISGHETFVKYAVLLPLVEKEDELHVLFEVRALQLRRQPGEICFPGGKMDKEDLNEQATAIRETTEELRISSSIITNIAPLDYIVSPFGTIIYPFAGFITRPELINPNTSEVEKVFTVPLSNFLRTPPDCYKVNFNVIPEENFPIHLISGGENYKWQTRQMNEYFYYYENYVIWGLTAGILKQFVELVS